MKELIAGFEKIVRDPSVLEQMKDLSGNRSEYPAAPGGLRAYWDTKCMYHGWKLQKNYYFGYYRILDEYGRKMAFGSEDSMIAELEMLAVIH